jgi:anaerobic magnesium-protoporphyrin IX monomethyl ester cyclase
MLSILVGHSYFLRFDRKQFERAKPYPPLATLQVAALLRDQGHSVTLFDAMLADGPAEYARKLEVAAPRLALFYEDNFNFLSKMCLGRMRAAAAEMVGAARDAGCFVIVAGSDASDAPSAYLDAGADIVLLGEGLGTLKALIDRLDAAPYAQLKSLIEGLSGLVVRSGESTAPSAGMNGLPVPQLAALPAWDLVEMGRYRDVWMSAHGQFSLNTAASRGCSFRCNWCAKPIWGNRYLQRAAPEVAAEVAHLKRTYAPDHLWFADDIFGFRADWVEQFAAAMRERDAIVPFTIQTRADLTSERMVAALQAAGCAEAWIGAESGSQRILDAMNKGTTVTEILTARERLRAHGIRVGFFIQLGYLGEQLQDILATRKLIEEACPDDIGVSVSYPLPGTRFYEQVKEQLGGKTHWSESDDLAMMFHGSYRSEFYRAIRDLLHDQVSASGVTKELRTRWHELLLREADYRLDAPTVAIAG